MVSGKLRRLASEIRGNRSEVVGSRGRPRGLMKDRK
jgi:hypothetical protein